MVGENKPYGTYGEGGIRKGEIIWNVNKEYRKEKKESMSQQIEAHKEEIQKSLKDIKENKGQQAEVLIEQTQKSLKELEENANKQIKELRKTIQDLKRK